MRLSDIRPVHDGILSTDLSAEVRSVGTHAEAVLDRSFIEHGAMSTGSAKRLLDRVWTATLGELTQLPPTTPPGRISCLTSLLGTVRTLESRIDESRVAANVEVMRSIHRSLVRLQSAKTVDELLKSAAEEVISIGFDRALISTVERGRWNLHTMVIEKDPRLAEEMVAAGREHPPALDGTLVESDVVDRGEPGLVYDVQDNPRVDRTLVAISGCTSYGVAPINVGGRVMGLVHADAHYARRPVDNTDQSILNLFGEGLGHALARATVLERVSALTTTLSDLTGGAVSPSVQNSSYGLSGREVEVLERMAAGDNNRMIARRLTISEGTVKTHITHILRKLDAGNRAEAVAYWLRR
ncbi:MULTISPECIES: LuxR C-terminal-related transcriptional regulator [Rhodococcus]|nr:MULTISPECIES: LuxR C-terminal-related transcriptional regulator [Rhodococcus]MDV7242658.1 LuxR C-terminal-related transcriptional regulator [Rhodococcus oxybenzonivorans]MDV7276091.1 LuxR C-terminal-related transcriptional regulator [Rhodococcus oxybenzonivorans]MDV7332146.1 LuxR C-terminal-related transcriptional regulator [Rhodococcus oxybenzonivorans]MDV7344351.1 LuxR C-terminal-related transcriptional regulator [Rhodococcus oxybenzonivorans]MDV8027124.1 LuxR C-terminal-related transcrip